MFLTIADLAKRWKMTPNAVKVKRSRGELPPAVKIGRSPLWPLEAIESFEAERTEGVHTPARPRLARPARAAAVKDYSSWFKEGRKA